MDGNSLFVLQFLLPLLTLCVLYNGDIFKYPICEKVNVPLFPEPKVVSHWKLCEKLEYLDSILREIKTCVTQTVICSMAFLFVDTLICFVCRRTIVERKVRQSYIVFILALIGLFMLAQGIVFNKITVNSISGLDLKIFVSLFSEIKIVPEEFNKNMAYCFVMFIDKVILFAPFLVATETLYHIKRMCEQFVSSQSMEIESRQVQLCYLQRRVFKQPTTRQTCLKILIPANNMFVKTWPISNGNLTIADPRQWQYTNDYQLMVDNLIWSMSENETVNQVMLQCADVIDIHPLNDSEATLLRWLCLCTTSALFQARGDIQGIATHSSYQLRKISKLGSMLGLKTQTFNGMRVISNLEMVTCRHDDTIFDITLLGGSLFLNANIIRSRKTIRGGHSKSLRLSAKFLPPLQPRIQRRLSKYNVISMSGSAQRVNEALEEFEKRTIQLIHNPFVR